MQVFTKAWSAALLNALGDILAQKVVDKNDKLDFKRLGIFTFLVSNALHLPIQSNTLHSTTHGIIPSRVSCAARSATLLEGPRLANIS